MYIFQNPFYARIISLSGRERTGRAFHDHVLATYHDYIMDWLKRERPNMMKYFPNQEEAMGRKTKGDDGGLHQFSTPSSIAEWGGTRKLFLDDDLIKRNYEHLLQVEISPEIQQLINSAKRKYNLINMLV